MSVLAFGMALLVGADAGGGGIHSLLEVVLGAILGVVLTTLIFQLWF